MTDNLTPSFDAKGGDIFGSSTLLLCPVLPVGQGGKEAAKSINLRTPEGKLQEAIGLTAAIELELADARIVTLRQVSPPTYFGKGKVEEIAVEVKEKTVGLVVVDTALSPTQQRNLEEAWHCKVIDRTQLILEIFGDRARTREGTLQVELAAQKYQKGRLVRSWTHLERQRGGSGFLGGPGERQLELDRRQIEDRIRFLEKELERVKRMRELHRKKRREVPYPVVALAGYTNAGKSTLFNILTGAEVTAEDKLFATLDPTLRLVKLPSGMKIMLSDTVGFVSDLPTTLVAAFRATLEEVLEAEIILHVRDISHPETQLQKMDVLHVLKELGVNDAQDGSIIEVWNKVDLLNDEQRTVLENEAARAGERAVAVSALKGEGLEPLLALLDVRLRKHFIEEEVVLEAADGKRMAWLHSHGEVISEDLEEERMRLRVRMAEEDWKKFRGV